MSVEGWVQLCMVEDERCLLPSVLSLYTPCGYPAYILLADSLF